MHDYVEKRKRRRRDMWKSANHFLRLPQCIIGRDIWGRRRESAHSYERNRCRWEMIVGDTAAFCVDVLCGFCDAVAKPRQCFWMEYIQVLSQLNNCFSARTFCGAPSNLATYVLLSCANELAKVYLHPREQRPFILTSADDNCDKIKRNQQLSACKLCIQIW
jgi:hypothetical protein